MGGEVTVHRIRLPEAGFDLELDSRNWRALGELAELLGRGATVVRQTDGSYRMELLAGHRFDMTQSGFASAVMMLYERFVLEEYAWLQVLGRVVIDIGANIGDSAVYFARHGASHVYAYEPFPDLYEQARRNVDLNGCDGTVTLVNAGAGPRHEVVPAVFEAERAEGLSALPRGDGSSRPGRSVAVRILPFAAILRQVVAKHPQQRLVGKIDCEGCEWSLLDGDDVHELLLRFDQIHVELHGDHPGRLIARLQRAGLETEIRSNASGARQTPNHLLARRTD
jgi:FkbM family methyltransferase